MPHCQTHPRRRWKSSESPAASKAIWLRCFCSGRDTFLAVGSKPVSMQSKLACFTLEVDDGTSSQPSGSHWCNRV